MTLASSEQRLRDEARVAILKAIKTKADHIARKQPDAPGSQLRDLAEAYAVLTSTDSP
ncbi:hypothetical protein [Actinocorallia sp. A-T 12471]|uniref:hypothetical protein n=1 Tax=Actinocorallia sp. A-T 12471 TaxID=3089813 RepID=UPI0029D06DE2|nr:hypothetical protein [Actinocorallia sp. A-T 12471]MDX6740415.1 hypothetical protein [Actinocorallia sp. A-T 12471]